MGFAFEELKVYQRACKPSDGWSGWPEQKQFALILMHDVDTVRGHDKAHHLMELEKGRSATVY
jgi:hypothetical protein